MVGENGHNGVTLSTSQSDEVSGNWIGTDDSCEADLGNKACGVLLTNGAASSTIGGTLQGGGNVIGNNAVDGVAVIGANGNTIVGNWIGTDDLAIMHMGNGADGSV